MESQTALISGGAGGIGRAIALALSQAGVKVALIGRDRSRLETAQIDLAAQGADILIAPCDVTNREQTKAAVADVLSAWRAIDILVCNAGINIAQRSLRSIDPADWDRVLATNLTGAFNLMHFVLPSMRERGRGLVVQVSSVSGMRANVLSGAAYSASKFAQAALGICLGREERGRGIRSTVIYPGEVNTAFLNARGARPGGGDETRRQGILQPEDIASTVRFLAELPPHVHIPELVIKPTIDDFF